MKITKYWEMGLLSTCILCGAVMATPQVVNAKENVSPTASSVDQKAEFQYTNRLIEYKSTDGKVNEVQKTSTKWKYKPGKYILDSSNVTFIKEIGEYKLPFFQTIRFCEDPNIPTTVFHVTVSNDPINYQGQYEWWGIDFKDQSSGEVIERHVFGIDKTHENKIDIPRLPDGYQLNDSTQQQITVPSGLSKRNFESTVIGIKHTSQQGGDLNPEKDEHTEQNHGVNIHKDENNSNKIKETEPNNNLPSTDKDNFDSSTTKPKEEEPVTEETSKEPKKNNDEDKVTSSDGQSESPDQSKVNPSKDEDHPVAGSQSKQTGTSEKVEVIKDHYPDSAESSQEDKALDQTQDDQKPIYQEPDNSTKDNYDSSASESTKSTTRQNLPRVPVVKMLQRTNNRLLKINRINRILIIR